MILTGSRPRLDAALGAAVLRPPPVSAVADPEQPGAMPLRIVTTLSTSTTGTSLGHARRDASLGTRGDGHAAFTALDLQVDCSEHPSSALGS